MLKRLVEFIVMSLTLQECIGASSDWLSEIQDPADGGWGQYKGDSSNSLNTAEAILGLLESGAKEPSDIEIQRGVAFLHSNQIQVPGKPGGVEFGYWSRDLTKGHQTILIPDVVRTAFALRSLIRAGVPLNQQFIVGGIHWLLSIQNVDGGWGYSEAEKSSLFPTCIVLKLLLRTFLGDRNLAKAFSHIDQEKCLCNGLGFIRQKRNQDGSFGDQFNLLVPHTIHVIDLIHSSATCNWEGLSKKSYDYLKSALRWIEDNRSGVLRWSTEIVLIRDQEHGSFEYIFSHVNPSLYLRYVFPRILELSSGRGFDWEGSLAYEALLVTYDNIDPTPSGRGFCARRPVSWATSQTIAGLHEAMLKCSEFPERTTPSAKLGERQYALLFLVFISFIAFILSILEKLNGSLLAFFQFLILAMLLVYGFLSEKSWVSIVRNKLLLK